MRLLEVAPEALRLHYDVALGAGQTLAVVAVLLHYSGGRLVLGGVLLFGVVLFGVILRTVLLPGVIPIVPPVGQYTLEVVEAACLALHEIPGPRLNELIGGVALLDYEVILPHVVSHALEVPLDGEHHLLEIVHPTELATRTAI